MDDELGTDPEFLWRLLLVQIVYDQLISRNNSVDFNIVAQMYCSHPLLPTNAPVLSKGAHAETVYKELLTEYEIDTSKSELEQCQVLAEPLYASFHQNLAEQMEKDVVQFEEAYRNLEEQEDFPKDERLEIEQQETN